jgi:hypothetical protein
VAQHELTEPVLSAPQTTLSVMAAWDGEAVSAGSDEPAHTGARRQLSDPEAAARRAALRAERVAAGLDELDRWLRDRIRSGLAGLEHAGYAEIDRIAARMVDAQAPGVANLLRAIPAELAGPGWPARVLEQFAALHLLIQAHRRLGELPPDLQATVRSRVGYPVAKQDVLARPAVADRWLAVGMVDVVEFRLETRRVWLHGQTTGRWALWLNFAPPGGYLDTRVLPGQLLDAELHFYPGSGQQRALIGRQVDLGETVHRQIPTATKTLADVQRRFATLLAEDPWASRMPALIEATPIPRASGEPWLLRDRAGTACRLVDPSGEPWSLLARSGGQPIVLFGEWDGRALRPLGVLPDDHGLPYSVVASGQAA